MNYSVVDELIISFVVVFVSVVDGDDNLCEGRPFLCEFDVLHC